MPNLILPSIQCKVKVKKNLNQAQSIHDFIIIKFRRFYIRLVLVLKLILILVLEFVL